MLISHTGCQSLHDNPRNVGDAELKGNGDKGGVMGVYLMPFLKANSKPTREDVIGHLNHAVKICGEDQVSIGTDGDSPALAIDDKPREEQRNFLKIAKPRA
jgi:membrane dipeptidase